MKNFIIVLLLLTTLGLGGFVVYDKVIVKEDYQKQIKDLKTEIKSLKEEQNNYNTTSNQQEKNTIIGYYKYGKISTPIQSCEKGLEQTTEINLLENGIYKYQYQSTCDSAKQTGKYNYNGNKLVLTCDPNNSEQCDGSPTEYIINDNGTLTVKDNQNIIFNKVSESELQTLK